MHFGVALIHSVFAVIAVLVRAQPAWSPIGNVSLPLSSQVDQIAYDCINRTLYMAQRTTLLGFFQFDSVPLTPLNAAPWPYSTVAGTGVSAPAGDVVEVPPQNATFQFIRGVIGWPQYAIGPSISAGEPFWVGLWLTDTTSQCIRFLNFFRRNFIVLTAGSVEGRPAAVDGLGQQVRLFGPSHIVWGRFPVDVAFGGAVPSTTTSVTTLDWTSVLYWPDSGNNCVRQGIPLHNGTTGYARFTVGTVASDLGNMILNVSSFAGVCANAFFGTAVGPVFPLKWMFNYPWGIALVHLGIPNATTGSILFVSTYASYRVAMIAPMYPPQARMLIALYTTISYLTGLTLAPVRYSSRTSAGGSATIDLFVASQGTNQFINCSFPISYDAITGSITAFVGASLSWTPVVNTSIRYVRNIVMIPFPRSGGGGSPPGTMILLNGDGGPVFQFFCCDDSPALSEPIDVGGESVFDGHRWRSERERIDTFNDDHTIHGHEIY